MARVFYVLLGVVGIFLFMTFAPIYFTSIAEREYSEQLFAQLQVEKGTDQIFMDDPDYLELEAKASNFGKKKFYKYGEVTAFLVGFGLLLLALLSTQISFLMSFVLASPLLFFSLFENADKVIFWLAFIIGCSGQGLKRLWYLFRSGVQR